MEDLVYYSEQIYRFDKLAILEVTMRFIFQLIANHRYEEALRLVRKAIEARNRTLGEMDPRALATSHWLPLLLNKTKRYKEAMKFSKEVLNKESISLRERL